MKKNVGAVDKVLRIVIAAILVILYLTSAVTGTLGIVLVLVALVLLLTAFISFCPLYLPFGISTCKKEAKK